MTARRKYSDFTLYRRLLREARAYWPHIAWLFALSLLATPLALLNPIPLKIVVDSVLGAEALPSWFAWALPAGTSRSSLSALAAIAGLLVMIALVKQLLDLAFAVLHTYAGEKLVLAFRAKLFRHSQRL